MGSKICMGNGQVAPAIIVKKPLTLQKTTKILRCNGLMTDIKSPFDLENVTQIGDYGLACAYALGGWRYSYQNSFYKDDVYCIETIPDFSKVTHVDSHGLYKTFYGCRHLKGKVDFSKLTSICTLNDSYCFEEAFRNTGISEIDFSGFTSVYANATGAFGDHLFTRMCQDCYNLTKVNFHNCHGINFGSQAFYYAFSGCTELNEVDFSSLIFVTVSEPFSYAFSGCTSLTSLTFSSLKDCSGNYMFNYAFRNSALSTLYLPALVNVYKSAMSSMLSGCSNVIIHFPSNLDPQSGSTIISSLTGYPNFGGTNTVLEFDLPSTNHLIGVNTQEYERNPKDDIQNALAWRKIDTGTYNNYYTVDWTSYYTSTKNNPQVGDTIYSDPECTQVVTTIDSIN